MRICDQLRVNSECTFYGKTDCKDFDLEGKSMETRKQGLVEQNEMNKISEVFQAKRILVNLMILIHY